MVNPTTLTFQWIDQPDQRLVEDLTAGRPDREAIRTGIRQGRDRIVLLRSSQEGKLLGYVSFRYLSATQLFGALRDTGLANRIPPALGGDHPAHHRGGGRHLRPLRDYLHLLFTEVLAQALTDDCIYGVYRPYGAPPDEALSDVLTRRASSTGRRTSTCGRWT